MAAVPPAPEPKARSLNWDRFSAILERFPLPDPKITHPWTMSVA